MKLTLRSFMPQSLLAMVEITFASEENLKKGADTVQSCLRECKTASAFAVHEGKISFNMWFEGQADYAILNQIKAELSAGGLTGFNISSREFSETKQIRI